MIYRIFEIPQSAAEAVRRWAEETGKKPGA